MARLEEIYAKGGPKKLKVKDLAPPVKKSVSSSVNAEEKEIVLESSTEAPTPKRVKEIIYNSWFNTCSRWWGF